MTEKIICGMPPRCGKTLKARIEKIFQDMNYHYYYESANKNLRDDLRKVHHDLNHDLNCSDKAPHQEEIDYLASLGLSYPVIRGILESKYYLKVKENYND